MRSSTDRETQIENGPNTQVEPDSDPDSDPDHSYRVIMSWLLALPRNPVLAVGLPFILGSLSGFPTYSFTEDGWYNVHSLSGYHQPYF